MDAGTEVCLKPAEKLDLPHAPWDMTFDSQCKLWVFLENEDVNVLLYQYIQEHWEVYPLFKAFKSFNEGYLTFTNLFYLFIAV